MQPERLREHLNYLALDWLHLRAEMPTQPRVEGRRSNTQEYGHPASWASDKAAEITDMLSSWHDLLADHRNETSPPTGCEQVRVSAAWTYLECRCDELVQLVDREALQELPALHYKIRRTLGHIHPRLLIPGVRCKGDDCAPVGAMSLEKIVTVGGENKIQCFRCGWEVTERFYPLLVRMALEDTRKTG